MAQYSETFAGMTVGQNPTNFTDRYDTESNVSVETTSTGQDGRSLRFNTGDSGFIFQSFDDVDGDANRDNCEIVARIWCSGDDDNLFALVGRASGSGGSETCYLAGVRSTGEFYVGRYDSGTFGQGWNGIQSDDPASPWVLWKGDNFTMVPDGEWLYCRFRINGTGATVTLQARYWMDGQDEPTDWQVDVSDTSGSRITAAGWTGVGKQAHTSASYYDFVGVGTNGDTANIDAGTDPMRITMAGVQVLEQNTATPVRVTHAGVQVLEQNTATPVRVTFAGVQVLYKILPQTGQTIVTIINT